MSIEEIFENVGDCVEAMGDGIKDGLEEFAEDVEAFLNYVKDEVSDFFTGENDDEYPPIPEQNDEIELSSDGSPVLIKLTPEQQKSFQDITDRLHEKNEELNDLLQEQREWKAVHSAPNYTGVGPSESEYRYDAKKEFEKNGDTARYRDLLEKAEEARIKRYLD